jgi:hypothetical protein
VISPLLEKPARASAGVMIFDARQSARQMTIEKSILTLLDNNNKHIIIRTNVMYTAFHLGGGDVLFDTFIVVVVVSCPVFLA